MTIPGSDVTLSDTDRRQQLSSLVSFKLSQTLQSDFDTVVASRVENNEFENVGGGGGLRLRTLFWGV